MRARLERVLGTDNLTDLRRAVQAAGRTATATVVLATTCVGVAGCSDTTGERFEATLVEDDDPVDE